MLVHNNHNRNRGHNVMMLDVWEHPVRIGKGDRQAPVHASAAALRLSCKSSGFRMSCSSFAVSVSTASTVGSSKGSARAGAVLRGHILLAPAGSGGSDRLRWGHNQPSPVHLFRVREQVAQQRRAKLPDTTHDQCHPGSSPVDSSTLSSTSQSSSAELQPADSTDTYFLIDYFWTPTLSCSLLTVLNPHPR